MTGRTINRRQLTRGMLAAAGTVFLAAALPRDTAVAQELASANYDFRNPSFAGPQLAQAVTYVVQPGDSLWSIARAHGLASWQPIFEANREHLPNPNLIHVGLVLTIPTAGEAVPPAPDPAPAPAPPPRGTAEVCGFATTWVTQIIVDAAAEYGQSACEMLQISWCESRHTPSARHPQSGASGLFQFLPSTWRTTPYASSNIFNAWANAHAAGWMLSVGRRNEWVCLTNGQVQA